MQAEDSGADSAAERAAGPALLAAFAQPGDAQAALEQLLTRGFLNVEREVDGDRTVLIVDSEGHQDDARAILASHGGVEFDRPA